MELADRIAAFEKLGKFIGFLPDDDRFHALAVRVKANNGWFTEENLRLALSNWAAALSKGSLEKWLAPYAKDLEGPVKQKRIGVVMAGNIPMVGFHDLLCVLVSGHSVAGKLASDDQVLMPFLMEELFLIEPRFKPLVSLSGGIMEQPDAVIATGSNNSSRYFDYYFGKYPHLIRRNRNSVAILTGAETEEQLKALGCDVFQYFGLGCRNVSKLFIPKGYDIDKVFRAFFSFSNVMDNKKYANNYEYHKTLYLMNQAKLLDNGFILLKEDIALSSPVAVLFYEYYDEPEALRSRLRMDSGSIQCIVSADPLWEGAVAPGASQAPGLWDYADGADTMKFLVGLN